MSDEKPIFRKPDAEVRPVVEPDPMAEFSIEYHLAKERRQVDLSKKYGLGYWDALDEQVEERANNGLLDDWRFSDEW